MAICLLPNFFNYQNSEGYIYPVYDNVYLPINMELNI